MSLCGQRDARRILLLSQVMHIAGAFTIVDQPNKHDEEFIGMQFTQIELAGALSANVDFIFCI